MKNVPGAEFEPGYELVISTTANGGFIIYDELKRTKARTPIFACTTIRQAMSFIKKRLEEN